MGYSDPSFGGFSSRFSVAKGGYFDWPLYTSVHLLNKARVRHFAKVALDTGLLLLLLLLLPVWLALRCCWSARP